MIGQVILTLVYGINKLPEGESHLALAERALGGILFTFTPEFYVACLLNDLSGMPQNRQVSSALTLYASFRLDTPSRMVIPSQETE